MLTQTEEKNIAESIGSKIAREIAAIRRDVVQLSSRPKAVYSNIGEQLQDVAAMARDRKGAVNARERYQRVINAATGASTGVGSDGGFLVETDSATDIRETAIQAGVLSSRCERQNISNGFDGYSYLTTKDRDRSQKAIGGGVQVYRKGETDLMQSSGTFQFEDNELRLEDLYGLVYVTNRLLRDAEALSDFVYRSLKKQFAWKLDYEIWQGTGVGECLGITNSNLMLSVDKEIDQAANTISGENVTKMLDRFYGDIRKASWFINQDCLPVLPGISLNGQSIYSAGDSAAPFGRLCGLPIEPLEFCSSIGSAYDIVLGDFSQYLLIDKGAIEASVSVHVKFLTDQTAFRFIMRNNGQPERDLPITPLHGTSSLSPFVALQERG